METVPVEKTGKEPGSEIEQEMVKYGITRVPIDYFYLGNFRYTNLDDAIAEAKRQRRHLA